MKNLQEIELVSALNQKGDLQEILVVDPTHSNPNPILVPNTEPVPVPDNKIIPPPSNDNPPQDQNANQNGGQSSNDNNANANPSNEDNTNIPPAGSSPEDYQAPKVDPPLDLLIISGHDSDLVYDDHGQPGGVVSQPEFLNVGPVVYPNEHVELPTEHVTAEKVGSSCNDLPHSLPIEVFFQGQCGGPFDTPDIVADSILNFVWSFTLEKSGSSTIIDVKETIPYSGTFDVGFFFVPPELGLGLCCPNTLEKIVIQEQNQEGFFIIRDFFSESGFISDPSSGQYHGPTDIEDSNIFNILLVSCTGKDYALTSSSFDGIFSSDGFVYGPVTPIPPPACSSNGSGTTPIVLELNSGNLDLVSASDSKVGFDVNGTPEKSGWVGPDNGLLVYNYSGEGPISPHNFILTSLEPGAKTDLDALAMLAGENGGTLNTSNPIWNKLGVWQDLNQNGVLDHGEYHTLAQLGINAINLTETGPTHTVNGNTVFGTLTYTYTNGHVGVAANVSLQLQAPAPNSTSSHTNTSSPAGGTSPQADTLVESTLAALHHASTTHHH